MDELPNPVTTKRARLRLHNSSRLTPMSSTPRSPSQTPATPSRSATGSERLLRSDSPNQANVGTSVAGDTPVADADGGTQSSVTDTASQDMVAQLREAQETIRCLQELIYRGRAISGHHARPIEAQVSLAEDGRVKPEPTSAENLQVRCRQLHYDDKKRFLKPMNVHLEVSDEAERAVIGKAEVRQARSIFADWLMEQRQKEKDMFKDLAKKNADRLQSLPNLISDSRLTELFVDREENQHTIKMYGTPTYGGIFFDGDDVAKAFQFDLGNIMRSTSTYYEGKDYVYFHHHERKGSWKYVVAFTFEGFERTVFDKMKRKNIVAYIYLCHLDDFIFKYGMTFNLDKGLTSLYREMNYPREFECTYAVPVDGINARLAEKALSNILSGFHCHLSKEKKHSPFPSTELCRLTNLSDFDRTIQCMNRQQSEYLTYEGGPSVTIFEQSKLMSAIRSVLESGK